MREPIQIGAELYGHAGVESDIEIQTLMVKALEAAAGVDGGAGDDTANAGKEAE